MSDWHTLLGIFASILLLGLVVPYLLSIIKSTTRPSPVSWFGWALLFCIATIAQASKGIDWSLAVPLISTLSATIVAVTALFLGKVAWTRVDGVCITLAAFAVILWLFTKEPLAAIIVSILADLFVTLPTIIKTYKNPKTEPAVLWILYTTGAFLEVIATREFSIYNLLFPIYTILGACIITIMAARIWWQK